MLGDIDEVLKIRFTIPVTTSTAERSFSSVRRLIKYHASNKIEHVLYVHTEKTDELDLLL